MTDSGDLSHPLLGELFERALALPHRAQAAFIERACGADAALRDQLASLLESHVAAPDYLETIRQRVLSPALAAFSRSALTTGSVIGRYEIVEHVGSGGMAEVYKARDRTLDRLVALKVLPAHRTADADARARLLSEARAVSALDHPSIAVVYDIGMTDAGSAENDSGQVYIAMAFYEGETLRNRMDRALLPVRDVLDYAIQLVDGLGEAHDAGVIHRDIKPANIVLTDLGRLRIVDFGVATVTGTDDARLSGRGTVAYMSPEQTLGGTVDHRSDIWAVGVVLYEMLAGSRPFAGETHAALIRSIREDEPADVRTLRADIPAELGRLIGRCLAKDPSRRYLRTATLLADLRALAGTLTGGATRPDDARPAVLVLPFVNLSADPEDEYVSDGLTEEVIGELSHIRSLRVIARTSAMRLKGRRRDMQELAHDLGIHYMLEGAVRKAGDALRITARFIEALRGDILWARTFEGTTHDIFEIQEQVARAIVEALRIRLSREEAIALAERPIPDARAYESYLRARYEAWRFSRDGLARAQRYIHAALAIVGDNEMLYGTLGHITAMHLEAGIDPDAAAVQRVDRIADKMFELNPASGRAHWLKAFGVFQRGDVRAAITAGERALALMPDDPDTLLLLGYVYAHAGRTTDARSLLEQAVQLDPLTPLTQCMPGFVAVLEGRFTDAIEPYRRLYQMDPESPFAAVTFAWVLAYNRRFDEATAILDEAAVLYHGTAFASWAASLGCALRGDDDAAARAITPAFIAAAHHSEMFARALAQCYALAGRTGDALHWLDRAIDLGMLNYPFLAEHDWFLQNLRTEPRFARLLERVHAAGASTG